MSEELESHNSIHEIEVTHVDLFSGPLPHPSILAQYESVSLGLADRIMKMAEKQSEHRQLLERKIIFHDRMKSILGLIFAFLIVISAFILGAYLIFKGQPVTGVFFSAIPLSSIVFAFIYQQKEEKTKDKE